MRKKGISLIVLVTTIILIIILAGAVLLSLSQNNPISQASEATFKQNIGEYKSELALYIANQYSKSGGIFNAVGLNKTGADIKTVITSMKDEDTTKFAIEKGQLVYLDSMNNTEKTWAQNTGINKTEVTPYTKSNAAVIEGSTGTSLTSNSTIDGQNPTYNDPIIPSGFFAVNTTTNWGNLSTDWNNGLVIQDNYGNQFVWVPVKDGIGTNGDYPAGDTTLVKYEKWCTTNISYLDTADDSFPESLNEIILANKYHGFYIGRYEASFDYNSGSLRIATKKSTNCIASTWTRDSSHTGYLWNYISYTDSKSYAENMDTGYGYDTTKIGTNLITGTEWDTTMKWIKNAGINVSTDSTAWGNYNKISFTYTYPTSGTKAANTSMLLNTGAASRNSAKNIYDLAGNMWEWTNEKYSDGYVFRGGYYDDTNLSHPADHRVKGSSTYNSDDIGVRLALYVK